MQDIIISKFTEPMEDLINNLIITKQGGQEQKRMQPCVCNQEHNKESNSSLRNLPKTSRTKLKVGTSHAYSMCGAHPFTSIYLEFTGMLNSLESFDRNSELEFSSMKTIVTCNSNSIR
jgi:hypothetical protein